MNKVVAIHQPNFAPWLGYFYKIKNCDAFVILDNVDYQSGNANSITNRTKIKTLQGELFITVPVKHTSEKLIKDILIDNDQAWSKKMLRTIELNYTKSFYFKDYFPTFEKIVNQKYSHLSEFNIAIIKQCCEWLGIKTQMHLASELNVNAEDKNERIIEICKRLGGTIYLSGSGGKKYNDESKFNENGIQLQYTSFTPQPYSQLHGEFIGGLSVLDVLFNCGDESKKLL